VGTRLPISIHGNLVGIALAVCHRAPALDPALDISQYARTTWKIGDGLFSGPILSMAQTTDGFLWLGTGVWRRPL